MTELERIPEEQLCRTKKKYRAVRFDFDYP